MNITPDIAQELNTLAESMQTTGFNMTLGMMEIDYPWPEGQELIKNSKVYHLLIELKGERYSRTLLENLKCLLEGLKSNNKTKEILIRGTTRQRTENKTFKQQWIDINIQPFNFVAYVTQLITKFNKTPAREIYYVYFYMKSDDFQENNIKGYLDFAQLNHETNTVTWYHHFNDVNVIEESNSFDSSDSSDSEQ